MSRSPIHDNRQVETTQTSISRQTHSYGDRQIYRDTEQVSRCQGLGEQRTGGVRVSSQDDENMLELSVGMTAEIWILKATDGTERGNRTVRERDLKTAIF